MVLSGAKIKVKPWYQNKYVTDEVGESINDEIVFGDLWDCLKNGEDFYRVIGVGDSLVRERLFVKLAEIFHVSYEYIYGMWLARDV